jgi:hypothetical protein
MNVYIHDLGLAKISIDGSEILTSSNQTGEQVRMCLDCKNLEMPAEDFDPFRRGRY